MVTGDATMVLSQEATTMLVADEIATTTSVSASSSELIAPLAVATGPQVTTEHIPNGNVEIGDFVVGPGRVEVRMKPGETVVRDITVTNRISANRDFELYVEDMSGSADGAQAVVLLGDQNGPYSLRDYVTLPTQKLTLGLGERARIPVSITMPPNAEPGGYYGGVLVTTIQDDGQRGGELASSPIIARVGTLFFITVEGDAEVSGVLTDFAPVGKQWLYTKGPIPLGITYENTGSIHLNPAGEIRVRNMLGAEVGFVELEPWFVLPKSLRVREVTWDREFLFGRYVITAQIDRGYDNVIDTAKTVVWVIPIKYVLITFGSLFVFFFLVRLFFRTFEFKKK